MSFPWESAETALYARGQARCDDDLSLDELRSIPGLHHGLTVVVDPFVLSPGADVDDERTDTRRMESHLIDVDELRPSVTSDATALLQLGRGGRPPVPGHRS